MRESECTDYIITCMLEHVQQMAHARRLIDCVPSVYDLKPIPEEDQQQIENHWYVVYNTIELAIKRVKKGAIQHETVV